MPPAIEIQTLNHWTAKEFSRGRLLGLRQRLDQGLETRVTLKDRVHA